MYCAFIYFLFIIIIIIIIVVVLTIINTYIILFKNLNTLFFPLVSRGPWKKQHIPTAIHYNHNSNIYIRVVMVHVFVLKSFSKDISVPCTEQIQHCFNHYTNGTSLETSSFIYCHFW